VFKSLVEKKNGENVSMEISVQLLKIEGAAKNILLKTKIEEKPYGDGGVGESPLYVLG